eukprot:CAMPEP_0202877382 /NCGR_PEP_ID=MMETSP1391-20130828/30568_1 /ASSEMBLY_ACC=CAM_ASM_000867 /TAXON_ID=1034604 /ORGANISM="Chlamydomonas leiostraca, Strain SAG 11-49" /LENGTH=84 /DNA_ID=CAMNT_0049559413 /DNA_START=151 /DNA_END=402 /DNA_ORIENTATION=+
MASCTSCNSWASVAALAVINEMLLPLAPTAAHADDPSQQSAAIAIAMQTHHMNLAPPPAQPHAPAAPSTRRGTHARRREAHTRP